MSWNNIKKMVQTISWKISPRLSCTISYYHNRGRLPNFSKPMDLSEIVFSQMISGEVKNFAPYVDKVKVRNYISEWGLGEYLPKLYGVWKHGRDIDPTVLPDAFALKTNNFCGGHLFCTSKKDFNFEKAALHMDEELKEVSHELRESQYNSIEPLIFAEELIVDSRYIQPMDYKFHCCDGEVKGCLLCSDRGTQSGFKVSFYDTDWVSHPEFLRGGEKSDKDFEKPENYETMLLIANTISQHFKQVRVDLYNIFGRIYIGELTFTPEGGMMSYYTNTALEFLGHSEKCI